MLEHSGQPDESRRPTDDLRVINGIGPVVALRLAGAGITTYRGLAALSAERVADLLAGVAGISIGRIVSQDWIGQARRLAGDLSENPEGPQRYSTFHVELLVAPDGEVRRTRVRHYQSDTEDSWPGWDQKQLMAIFLGKSALDPSSGPMPASKPPTPPPAPPPIHIEGPGPAAEGSRRSFRFDDQPTMIRMNIRVGPTAAIDADDLEFVAEVAARAVDSGDQRHLGSIKGKLAIGQPSTLELTAPPLPAGLYSLAADVTVYRRGYQPAHEPLWRYRGRGDLLHVTHLARLPHIASANPPPRVSRGWR